MEDDTERKSESESEQTNEWNEIERRKQKKSTERERATEQKQKKAAYSHETAQKEHFLVCELNFNQNKYCIILVWSSAVKIE